MGDVPSEVYLDAAREAAKVEPAFKSMSFVENTAARPGFRAAVESVWRAAKEAERNRVCEEIAKIIEQDAHTTSHSRRRHARLARRYAVTSEPELDPPAIQGYDEPAYFCVRESDAGPVDALAPAEGGTKCPGTPHRKHMRADEPCPLDALAPEERYFLMHDHGPDTPRHAHAVGQSHMGDVTNPRANDHSGVSTGTWADMQAAAGQERRAVCPHCEHMQHGGLVGVNVEEHAKWHRAGFAAVPSGLSRESADASPERLSGTEEK